MKDNCSTDSFRTAAYLLATGHPIIATSRSKMGRKVQFRFCDTPALQEAIQDFRFGDPVVSVRALFTAQSQIKSLIFDAPFSASERC
jgi:hypothetical protein